MEPVELRENGLLLRPWSPDDAEAVFRACQDPLIQHWTSLPRPYLLDHAAQFVTTQAPQAWHAGTGAPFAVVDPGTGELLGACGLTDIDRARGDAEIGYWTAPSGRDRGVATGAARAVARFGLAVLGLQRVQWRARVGNHASRLVAARIGVRFEGLLRAGMGHGETRYDGWIGALLPGDLRDADAPDDPALARATSRCRVFAATQPTLESVTRDGQAVRLRPLRSDDAPACVQACQDPLSVRYTTVPHPYDEKQAEAFIHTFAPSMWARGTEAVFAVADADDALVGTMALRLPGDELYTPTGDVGYLIGPWARGRGYASAALQALCDWGFANLALRRIEWQAYVGNTASRATAERAGFLVEGELRQALPHRGTFEDSWIGSRIAPAASEGS